MPTTEQCSEIFEEVFRRQVQQIYDCLVKSENEARSDYWQMMRQTPEKITWRKKDITKKRAKNQEWLDHVTAREDFTGKDKILEKAEIEREGLAWGKRALEKMEDEVRRYAHWKKYGTHGKVPCSEITPEMLNKSPNPIRYQAQTSAEIQQKNEEFDRMQECRSTAVLER